eukprot:jgi/Bigna1/74969/fgenesh1_pg.32_\
MPTRALTRGDPRASPLSTTVMETANCRFWSGRFPLVLLALAAAVHATPALRARSTSLATASSYRNVRKLKPGRGMQARVGSRHSPFLRTANQRSTRTFERTRAIAQQPPFLRAIGTAEKPATEDRQMDFKRFWEASWQRKDQYAALPYINVGLHSLALYAILFVNPGPAGLLACFLSYGIRMFGITAGYHRLFSHKSYKAVRPLQFILAVLGAASWQQGPLWWAAHHREHHMHSDSPLDAHSPISGSFWWSHMGWVWATNQHDKTNTDIIQDLLKFPELVWLEKHHFWPGLFLMAGLLAWNGISGVLWGFVAPSDDATSALLYSRREANSELPPCFLLTLLGIGRMLTDYLTLPWDIPGQLGVSSLWEQETASHVSEEQLDHDYQRNNELDKLSIQNSKESSEMMHLASETMQDVSDLRNKTTTQNVDVQSSYIFKVFMKRYIDIATAREAHSVGRLGCTMSCPQGLKWWEFDLTYSILRFLSIFRLTSDLKVPSEEVINKAQAKMAQKRADERANFKTASHVSDEQLDMIIKRNNELHKLSIQNTERITGHVPNSSVPSSSTSRRVACDGHRKTVDVAASIESQGIPELSLFEFEFFYGSATLGKTQAISTLDSRILAIFYQNSPFVLVCPLLLPKVLSSIGEKMSGKFISNSRICAPPLSSSIVYIAVIAWAACSLPAAQGVLRTSETVTAEMVDDLSPRNEQVKQAKLDNFRFTEQRKMSHTDSASGGGGRGGGAAQLSYLHSKHQMKAVKIVDPRERFTKHKDKDSVHWVNKVGLPDTKKSPLGRLVREKKVAHLKPVKVVEGLSSPKQKPIFDEAKLI